MYKSAFCVILQTFFLNSTRIIKNIFSNVIMAATCVILHDRKLRGGNEVIKYLISENW